MKRRGEKDCVGGIELARGQLPLRDHSAVLAHCTWVMEGKKEECALIEENKGQGIAKPSSSTLSISLSIA